MKEKLLERLRLLDNLIADQNKKLQDTDLALRQANADLNMMNGCRQELAHVISLCDAEKPAEGVLESCIVHDDCVDDSA